MKINEKEILNAQESTDTLMILKSFKGLKIGQKFGFLESLMSGSLELTWEKVIQDSSKEVVSKKIINKIL